MKDSIALIPPGGGLTNLESETSSQRTEPVGLTVLMPCHNEGSIVRRSVEETVRALKLPSGQAFEVVIVDDGSTDETAERIRDSVEMHPEVRVVRLEENGGKGHALRTALAFTSGSLVCFLDGDLDIHPNHILPFVHLLEMGHSDIVVGSKRHPNSQVDYPIERRAASLAYQLLLRILFGLRLSDTQAGIKLFRREVLERVFTRGLVKRYAYDAELLVVASHLGYRIQEAPIAMDFQSKFGSGVDLKAILKMFLDTLGIFYRLRITNYYTQAVAPQER
jgi:glycosyltransferase involved in cell wall biosynthesis